jgi:hypothetical protein
MASEEAPKVPVAEEIAEEVADGMVHVSIDKARTMTAKALKQIGWDDEDANIQAEIMTAAELCGNNQGLVKMYQPLLMAPSPNAAKPTIERETPTSAVMQSSTPTNLQECWLPSGLPTWVSKKYYKRMVPFPSFPHTILPLPLVNWHFKWNAWPRKGSLVSQWPTRPN